MSLSSPDGSSKQRLTRPGALIWDYSLDHLPTLINLLKGDLSITGPRPMETQVADMADPAWQQYFQGKPGLFNYAVLKLGKSWAASRVSRPGLNQSLELEYRERRSAISDLQLILQSLRGYVASRGNIKARGTADPR